MTQVVTTPNNDAQTKVYPIQVVTDKRKIKEYHLKRLYELSLKSLGVNDKK
jgi:hypothetical protein